MERDGRGMGTRRCDEVASLKVRERGLDGTAREPGGGGDGLMRCPDGPTILGCAAIKIKVNDERCGAAVMADQVGQKAVEQVRIQS